MSKYSADDTSGDAAPKETVPTVAEVTVTGPGISITRPVNEPTLAGIISLLFKTDSLPPAGRDTGHSGSESTVRWPRGGSQLSSLDEDLTLGEFIVEVAATTFQQKICAAGYYLMKFQNAESFNRDDVRNALADAHEDMPGNFARDFTSAAAAHLIAAKQGETGQFIIPRTGRTAVESLFQEVPKRRTGRKTAKKATAAKGAGE